MLKTKAVLENLSFLYNTIEIIVTYSILGMEQRLKVEARINQLEGGNRYRVSGTGKEAAKFDKYESKGEVLQYKTAADNTMAAPQKRKLIEDIRYSTIIE